MKKSDIHKCGNCTHWGRCSMMGYTYDKERGECDFYPDRFAPSYEFINTLKTHVDQARSIITWLWSGDVGISSKAILARTFGLPYDYHDSWPHGEGDRRRCIKLLAEIPECWQGLESLAAEYPQWREARREIVCEVWAGIFREGKG